jgi:hypothetical protein
LPDESVLKSVCLSTSSRFDKSRTVLIVHVALQFVRALVQLLRVAFEVGQLLGRSLKTLG